MNVRSSGEGTSYLCSAGTRSATWFPAAKCRGGAAQIVACKRPCQCKVSWGCGILQSTHSRAAKVYVLLSTMNHSCSPSVRLDTCAESGAEALQVRDNALFGTPTSAFVPGQLDHNHTGRGTVNKLRLQFFERGSSNRCRKKWSRTWHAQVGDRLTLAYVAPDWQEPQDTRTI